MPRTYVLRIFLNDGQPHVIAESSQAISRLVTFGRAGSLSPSLADPTSPGSTRSWRVFNDPVHEATSLG
jgi:hypothetical protein